MAADYPTRLEIDVPGKGTLKLSGTLSDAQAPTEPPVEPPIEPPVEPPTDGIIEKLYKPEDFDGDLTAMQSRILQDQGAHDDGMMRAIVPFQRGKTYEYAKNDWLTGVQNYRCEAVGSGARPKLRCTNTTGQWATFGPLSIGKGSHCFVEPNAEMDKNTQLSLIATAQAGAAEVTLLNSSDASRLRPGRWHVIVSYCQQIGGYPPNCRWIDYVKVTAVNGTRVSLDRALTHNHYADYWEDPADTKSIGKARIGLFDGFWNDIRCTLSGEFHGLEFVGEHQAGQDTVITEGHINVLFEDCIISNYWPSMLKQAEVRNGTLVGAGNQAAEPDKLADTLILDGVTQTDPTRYIGGATGFQHVIVRNCNFSSIQISPRNLSVTNSTIDSFSNTWLYVPIGWAFNGPILGAEFDNVTFKATTAAQPTWTYSQPPTAGSGVGLSLTSANWQKNKLIIPRSFAGFEPWLVWLYEGGMVFTGPRVFDPQNYGRVDKIYSPPDGSALWCDVTWISGTKPTSGTLHCQNHGLRKLTWKNGTQVDPGNWIEPDFICQEGTPGDRPFPQGIS